MMETTERSTNITGRTIDIPLVRCSRCNRKLKASHERIGDRTHVVCEHCYQYIVFPGLENSHEVRPY